MQKEIKNVVNLENMSMCQKMKHIYKWHNGTVLQNELREKTNDDTFEYIVDFEDNYTFSNANGDVIILNGQGEVERADFNIQNGFIESAQQRLQRTCKMIKQFSGEE